MEIIDKVFEKFVKAELPTDEQDLTVLRETLSWEKGRQLLRAHNYNPRHFRASQILIASALKSLPTGFEILQAQWGFHHRWLRFKTAEQTFKAAWVDQIDNLFRRSTINLNALDSPELLKNIYRTAYLTFKNAAILSGQPMDTPHAVFEATSGENCSSTIDFVFGQAALPKIPAGCAVVFTHQNLIYETANSEMVCLPYPTAFTKKTKSISAELEKSAFTKMKKAGSTNTFRDEFVVNLVQVVTEKIGELPVETLSDVEKKMAELTKKHGIQFPTIYLVEHLFAGTMIKHSDQAGYSELNFLFTLEQMKIVEAVLAFLHTTGALRFIRRIITRRNHRQRADQEITVLSTIRSTVEEITRNFFPQGSGQTRNAKKAQWYRENGLTLNLDPDLLFTLQFNLDKAWPLVAFRTAEAIYMSTLEDEWTRFCELEEARAEPQTKTLTNMGYGYIAGYANGGVIQNIEYLRQGVYRNLFLAKACAYQLNPNRLTPKEKQYFDDLFLKQLTAPSD